MTVILTKENTIGLWEHLQEEFGSDIKSKPDSDMMKSIGPILDAMGIMDQDVFMKRYTTTIFETIYIPFTLGDTAATPERPHGYPLFNQARLAVHEHMHVRQYQREGAVKFCGSYLLQKSARAHWEAEALLTGLEIQWFLTGRVSSPEHCAQMILNYGCGQDEAEYIEHYLKMAIPTLAAGGITSDVAQAAIDYFA